MREVRGSWTGSSWQEVWDQEKSENGKYEIKAEIQIHEKFEKMARNFILLTSYSVDRIWRGTSKLGTLLHIPSQRASCFLAHP